MSNKAHLLNLSDRMKTECGLPALQHNPVGIITWPMLRKEDRCRRCDARYLGPTEEGES